VSIAQEGHLKTICEYDRQVNRWLQYSIHDMRIKDLLDVRRAAIEALRGQANLTGEMLQAIAARLEHEDQYVRWAVVQTLLNQASLPSEVLNLYAKPLYKALLKNSFSKHLYLCASDLVFVGVNLRHVSLSCKQENQPSAKIREVQNYLGVPPPPLPLKI
jgi:site-specific recombinase XerC